MFKITMKITETTNGEVLRDSAGHNLMVLELRWSRFPNSSRQRMKSDNLVWYKLMLQNQN